MDFDWRKYAAVKGAELFDESGQPQRNVTQDLIDYNDRTVALTEKVMDQLSATPEFQKRLVESFENGPLRLLNADNQERLGDPRLVIQITPGGAIGYRADDHEIHLGLNAVSTQNYGDPPLPFSLQRIIFHETGHGADDDLSDIDAHELGIRKKVFETSMQNFLQRYPEYKNEFESSGTLFGNSVSPVRDAKSTDEFEGAFNQFVGNNTIQYDLKMFDDPTNARLVLMEPVERAQGYLYSTFTPALQDAIIKEDELPVIAEENDFMARYFGEKPRQSYESKMDEEGGKSRPDYKLLSESLSMRIHPSFDPASGVRNAPVIDGVTYRTTEKLLEPLHQNLAPQLASLQSQ